MRPQLVRELLHHEGMLVLLPDPTHDERMLGGKGAGLSRLLATGHRVPPACVLTVGAYEEQWTLPPFAALATEGNEPARVRERLLETPLSSQAEQAVRSAIEHLGEGPLAVRSSGVGEDSAGASFAGMHETLLEITGYEEICTAIRACWASAWSPRALAYRATKGAHGKPLMAVVLQKLVKAQFAGVVFTRDPTGKSQEHLLIEAVQGLGEALVSGRATPSQWKVHRDTLAVSETPKEKLLNEEQVRSLASLAMKLETEHKRPQDIEWAMDDSGLWLLQTRPITTELQKTNGPLWTNINAAEILPGVLTPMTVSIAKKYVAGLLHPLLSPFGVDAKQFRIVGQVAGRLYFDLLPVLQWFRSFPFAGSMSGSDLARMLGGASKELAITLEKLPPEALAPMGGSTLGLFRGVFRSLLGVLRNQSGQGDQVLKALRIELDKREAMPLETLSDRELSAWIDDCVATPFQDTDPIWCAVVGMGGHSLVRAMMQRWCNDHDGSLTSTLFSASGALASAQSGDALAALAEQARHLGVQAHLQEGTFTEAKSKLETTEAGRAFLTAWNAFLREHGHHARGESNVATPRWSEDPELVLAMLRAGLHSDSNYTERKQQRIAARNKALATVEERLGPLRRALFRAVFSRAEAGTAARENGRSEATRFIGLTRRGLLELGKRCTERGFLEKREDIFLLEQEELSALLEGKGPSLEELRARQQKLDAWAHVVPPPVVLGTLDPRDLQAEPTAQGLRRFEGIGSSPGIAVGKAKVVLFADHAASVNPGEVLVAPFTDPGWTPLFVHASAIVMDFGGALSHGSVVAREYGVPAVVNVGTATREIRDGMLLRVDGNKGVVEVLS